MTMVNSTVYWLTLSEYLGAHSLGELFFKTLVGTLFSMEQFSMFSFSVNMGNALSISIKFLLCMSLLMFASGGMPSFSFDYLTKLGWLSFLSLVLLVFLFQMLIMNTF